MQSVILEGRSYPSDPAPTMPSAAPRPSKAIVREVDFEVSADKNTLRFFYPRFNIETTVTPQTLKTVLQNVYSSSYGWQQVSNRPKRPFKSALSLENNEFVYLIFRLKEERKWQFSRVGWPITVGSVARGYFFEALRVDSSGSRDRGDDKELVRDGCKLAYVIAAGKEAFEQEDVFCHPINLHIDLITDELYDGGGTTRQPCYLPIIVDPDIRYPGGGQ